jgi:putative membrane protein
VGLRTGVRRDLCDPFFWTPIILGIIALAKWLFSAGGSGGFGSSGKAPLDILKERYARGEINREQYEQMRRDSSPDRGRSIQ